MRHHRLRRLDSDYLLRVLPLTAELRHRLEEFRTGRGDLSPSDCDELRELVGERLAEVGFDGNDEPTPEGQRLEELMDQLFTARVGCGLTGVAAGCRVKDGRGGRRTYLEGGAAVRGG